MCTLLRVIILFNMLVHFFTVLSFNCAFLLIEVRKRLYHNFSQLKCTITFRREIVSQVVGYQYISQIRSIDDFYCQRRSVCPCVILCSTPGAMRCLWQRTSLCRPVNESARVATVLVHRVILSRLV